MTFHAYGTTRELDTGDHELCLPSYEECEKQVDEMVTIVMGEVLAVHMWSCGAVCKSDKYAALGKLGFV